MDEVERLLIAGLDIEAKDDSRSPGAPRAVGQVQFRLEMEECDNIIIQLR